MSTIRVPGRPGQPERVTTVFVNYDTPDGGVGSIRVDSGTTCAAVELARKLGTGIVIRQVDVETGLTISLARVQT